MTSKPLLLGFLLVLAAGLPAAASPTMIRLGYPGCSPCHVSAQGGGLLTDYGKGIDVAQSLVAREYQPPPDSQNRRWRQDFRVLFSAHRTTVFASPETVSLSSGVQLWYRAAGRLTAHQTVSSIIAVNVRPEFPSTGRADSRVTVTKALWQYQLADGMELAVGRDVLPSGLQNADHEGQLRRVLETGSSGFPTQAKLFVWTKRLQLTPYVFGPSGVEDGEFRQYGGGALGGLVALRQHAVVGLSVRGSRSPTQGLLRYGAYARLGFGKWGVLTEHEHLGRSPRVPDSVFVRGSTGLLQVFFASPEWLVTSLNVEYVPAGSPGTYTYRVSPSAQIRISENFTLLIGEWDRFAEPTPIHSRSFAVQLFLKTVQ